MKERVYEAYGHKFATNELHRLFRERWLKISQVAMARLANDHQPQVAAHESGARWSDKLSAVYDKLGFQHWLSWCISCDEDASLIDEMLDPESWLQYMTAEQGVVAGLIKSVDEVPA